MSKGKRKWYEEVRLINEVRKRPKLYDRRTRYHDTPEGRSKLWEEILQLFPGRFMLLFFNKKINFNIDHHKYSKNCV